jgi:hypothetical protein
MPRRRGQSPRLLAAVVRSHATWRSLLNGGTMGRRNVTEADFFARLEYRLCGEFAVVRPLEAPGLWCDGLIPTHWQLDANPLTISGEAWVGGLPGHHAAGYQEKWSFVLKL